MLINGNLVESFFLTDRFIYTEFLIYVMILMLTICH